jgi:hypothetical protein
VARQTKTILHGNKLVNNSAKKGKHQLFSNFDKDRIEQFVKNVKHYKIEYLDF